MAGKVSEGKFGDGEGREKAFVVVQEGTGNERSGLISDSEIEQVVLDIVAWYERAVDACEPGSAAPSADDLKRLAALFPGERVPLALRLLHEKAFDDFYLHEFRLLPAAEAARLSSELPLGEGLVGIARNIDEDYLVLKNGGSVAVWSEDEGLESPCAENLGMYLERMRNELLSKKLEWLPECGLVAVAESPVRSHK